MEPIVQFPQLLFASLRDTPWIWASGMVLLIALAVLALWRRRGRQRRKLRRAMRRLGTQALNNVVLPDSVEGQIHIDYLVLSSAGILVVDVKDYRGMLFGGENTDVWTQVVDGRSYKFENPLYRNRVRETAVRSLAPGANVRGIVVFTEAGRFPRQRPAGVYMLASVADELSLGGNPVPANVQSGWERLLGRVASEQR